MTLNREEKVWPQRLKKKSSLMRLDVRKADGFDGGHFSPVMYESTHHFHRWVAGHFVDDGA
jgi:hypothetical protein